MPLDPRLPVVVGVGQLTRKPSGSVAGIASPPEMMAEALRLAAEDSGVGAKVLERADSLQCIEAMSWRAPDPAAVVAGFLGIEPKERVASTTGGNTPQAVMNQAAVDITSGRLDVVLVTGAEAMYSRRLAAKNGEETGWPKQDPSAAPTRVFGTDRAGTTEFEAKRSLMVPTQIYPIFECAVRADAGETVDEHQVKISKLWETFSKVASTNPYAWSPEPVSAERIRTADADNRMIGFPYPKLMNSNIQVDQAAAVIVCSVEAATALGIPSDQWVFLHAGADAHDHWFVSSRWSLGRSPAIGACGSTALGLAGFGIDDVAHVDLYSCFPSAVEVAGLELGLDVFDPSRPPTVTGGLCFGGGPGNNYVTHSIAAMVERLRANPGDLGVVTANGWYLTKHSIGLYSTEPPASGGFKWESAQGIVDASPQREAAEDWEGPVTVEAWTVLHERDGSPQLGVIGGLLEDGRRTWANTTDPALLAALVSEEVEGRPATVAGGSLSLA